MHCESWRFVLGTAWCFNKSFILVETTKKYFCELSVRCARNSDMRLAISFAALVIGLYVAGCAATSSDSRNYPLRERIEERPAATPTPTPTAPIYIPLDPTGQPQ